MANTNQQDNNRDSNNRDTQQNQSSGRGFASMDKDRQREIAAEGGRASHASGNAHEFNSQEARDAGSKSHGGQGSNASSGGSRNAGDSDNSPSGSTRGGTSEQHARAGSQSHKNDNR